MSTPEPPPYSSGDEGNEPQNPGGFPPPPPPPAAPQYGQYGAPAQGVVPGSKNATVSLVTGIIGLLCCVLLGIVAIVTGKQATAEAAAAGLPQPGNAKAGIILGWVSIALTVVGILAYALIFLIFGFSATMSNATKL